MDTRIPATLHDLLIAYMNLLEKKLPAFVTGLYLHGSIALDAFDENLSDIDFVAFLSRLASPSDLEQLAAIHQTIATRHPRWLLEGTYLQWNELGQLEEKIAPSPIHHDNIFAASGNFDVNSITWWILKKHGIALIGPQVQELPLDVDWELLVRQMQVNLNTYWASYIQNPRRIAWLLGDYGVQWTVLGVLRQYYTFVADDITSKIGAGEYALATMPDKWHRVIREAIRIRQQQPKSPYVSRVTRAADCYNFLRYTITYCNSLLI